MPATKKLFSFGACEFARTSPPAKRLSGDTKATNILIPFEEALKFNLAISQGLYDLNSYKLSTKEGKRAALNLTIYWQRNRIAINRGKV